MLKGDLTSSWSSVYLLFTALTLVTSFLFPIHKLTPALVVGAVCVVIFVVTVVARYRFPLDGAARFVFACGAILLLWFNCLVLVVQSFQKIPPLHALAPTGSEPVVAGAQGVLLVAIVALGIVTVRQLRNANRLAALSR